LKQNHKAFSANHFTDIFDIPFSPADYSRFKFGCKDVARKFGKELASKFIKSDLFINQLDNFKQGQQIVVIPSPYQFIPTATSAMKDYFIAQFNHDLIDMGLDPVQEGKIYRTITYTEDYGAMTSEERRKFISNDAFYIDREFVKNKFCIFMDDIKITGTHEEMVQLMADAYELDCSYIYLYYAQLDNPDTHPQIENFLNYASIKNLLDVNDIIQNQNFIFNTRVIKYILNAPYDECKNFLLYQSLTFRNTLYHYAIGNSYHKIDKYAKNLKYLRELI